MTVALGVSHSSATFLRRRVKLKEFQLSYAALLINVTSKTLDQSEDPWGGASIASFCLQYQVGMATVVFDGNMVEKVFSFLKAFLCGASCIFILKDAFS